jgi:hypothetical protein
MNEAVDIFSVGDATAPADAGPDHPTPPQVVVLDPDLRERASTRAAPGEPGVKLRVLELGTGPFEFDLLLGERHGWWGVLVLDGLLLVQLEAGRGHVGWLVGESDVLRPWELPDISLTSRTSWQALKPTRMALLDDAFAHRPHAEALVPALLSRSAKTAHWLLAKSLIISCPVLEDRLMLLFALLGERWGRVTVDGILVDLPLTHSLLSTLCGARRPSVTLALGELRNDGIVERAATGGWLLTRLSSNERATRLSTWQSYASALGLA